MNYHNQDVKPVRIGLIGCGKISSSYLRAAHEYPVLNLIACADINHTAAEHTAKEYGLQAMRIDSLLARDDIELILNLTVPAAHASVNLAALKSGKHTYCEKPFATSPADGTKVITTAREHGLRVGSAPDTFLGAGQQTVRRIIDSGTIGHVVSATAIWMGHGHEGWHHSPAFYYAPGGGPHFDMAPYYLTALVQTLGPVSSVNAMAGKAFDTRVIGSGPNAGNIMPVEVNTHLSGTIKFKNGCITTIVMSYDVWKHSNARLEFHGTAGSIAAPDPNNFGGQVFVAKAGSEWIEAPLATGPTANARSIGLADLCLGIRYGTPHRCNGELAQHVLEVIAAFDRSAMEHTQIMVNSKPDRPIATTEAN